MRGAAARRTGLRRGDRGRGLPQGGGGGGLAAAGRTCGGIEPGAAATPAPSGPGGRFWRGRSSVCAPAPGERLQLRSDGRRDAARLRGGRGCCTVRGAAPRRAGLMRGGRGCCAAEGAAARRSVRRRRTISRFFNFHLKCAAIRSCILSRILSDPADNTGGGAPLFRPTPEALSRGRGRGSAAAGPAGVCGDESVPIQRHRLLDRNERKECNATGNNHSILAREFNATSTERMLGKSYRWSLGLFSWPAADREGRFPMNKKINEGGIFGRKEFSPVSWIGMQLRPNRSPPCVQPCLQI